MYMYIYIDTHTYVYAMHIHIYIYVYTYIYIYIYNHTEREREIDIHMYIYIYIVYYIHTVPVSSASFLGIQAQRGAVFWPNLDCMYGDLHGIYYLCGTTLRHHVTLRRARQKTLHHAVWHSAPYVASYKMYNIV